MKIDTLIAFLQKVRKERGNVNVFAGSFCGTNNRHVAFEFEKIESLDVNDHLTDDGRLSLSVALSAESRRDIVQGIEEMKRLGYTYYRSQFVKESRGQTLAPGCRLANGITFGEYVYYE